jgi:Fe-S cluster biogenesis protein NfuA
MLDRMSELIEKIEAVADPAIRETSRELLREVLTLHGMALGRAIELAQERATEPLLVRLAQDPKVAPVLLLHGLHPEDLQGRVERALDRVRPYLHSHGGNVELVGIQEGRVRLRLEGSCQGCPSSAQTLRGAVEEAIAEAAPDAEGVEIV